MSLDKQQVYETEREAILIIIAQKLLRGKLPIKGKDSSALLIAAGYDHVTWQVYTGQAHYIYARSLRIEVPDNFLPLVFCVDQPTSSSVNTMNDIIQ